MAMSAVAQDAPLQWSLKQGDQFTLELLQNTTSETSVDSRGAQINAQTTLQFDWNVTDIDKDGTATIEQSIASIKLSMGDPQVPKQAVSYDTQSTKKTNSTSRELLKQAKSLLGLKSIVKMSRQGKTISVEIPDETTKQIDQLPEALGIKALFSKRGLAELMGASEVAFPTESNQKIWNVESNKPTSFGQFKQTRIYELGDVKMVEGKKMQEILLLSQVALAQQPTASKSPTRFKSFKGSGTMLFDLDGGFLAESNSSNTILTEREYREKVIQVSVSTTLRMILTKKK